MFVFTDDATPQEEMLKEQILDGVLMVETENVKHEPYTTTDEIKASTFLYWAPVCEIFQLFVIFNQPN